MSGLTFSAGKPEKMFDAKYAHQIRADTTTSRSMASGS